MGIFGWSLPPGCSTLPGEDAASQADEALMDAIYDLFEKHITGFMELHTKNRDFEKLADAIFKLAGETYSTGYKDGMADESLAREWPAQEQV